MILTFSILQFEKQLSINWLWYAVLETANESPLPKFFVNFLMILFIPLRAKRVGR